MGTGASHTANNNIKAKSGSLVVGGAAGMPSSAAVNAAAAASAGGGARRAPNKHQQRASRLNAIIPASAVEYLSCLPWAKFGIQPPPPPIKIPPVPVFLGANLSRSTIFKKLKTIGEDPASAHPVRVIFIFGGPGTYKGRMIDDIINMFGMQLLSGENIIIKHLFNFFSQHRKAERDKQQAERMAKMPIGGGFGARPKSPTPSLTSIDHKLTEIRQLENVEMKKLQELLRMRPELLTLEWLLSRIADEIEYGVQHDRYSGFLVDIMPNQRFLLKSEFFIKECSNELAAFEARFPIALCLNLAMPQEKLLEHLDTPHKAGDKIIGGAANHNQHHNDGSAIGSSTSLSSIHSNTTQNSTTSASSITVAAAGDEPLPSLPSGTSDEMDASRMQKRYTLYESSAYYFLSYFTHTGRVLTIDCSSKLPPLIWQKLCDSFIELGFEPDRPSSVVILFGFEPDTFALYDLSRYRIAHVYLADILADEADDPKTISPEQAYVAINKHVHNDMAKATAFAVELNGTVLASNVIGAASRPTSSAPTVLKTARIEPITAPSTAGGSTSRTTSSNERGHHHHRRGSKSADNNAVRGFGQAPKVFPTSSRSSLTTSSRNGILHHADKNGETPADAIAVVGTSSIYPAAATASAKPAASSSRNNSVRRRIPKLVSPRQKEDLLFVEVHEVLLDKYVQLQSGNVRKLKRKNSLSARRFKAICFPEQELVCLFPDSVDTRTCKIISTGIVNAKRKVYRDRRDSRRSSNQSDPTAAGAGSSVEVFNNNNMNGAGSTTNVAVPTTPTFQLSRPLANKLIPPIAQH